jgi:enoyl-CoA hydratase/carnithine racemase
VIARRERAPGLARGARASYTPARIPDARHPRGRIAPFHDAARAPRRRPAPRRPPHPPRRTEPQPMETTQAKLVLTSVKNGVMTIELTFDPGNCYTHEMMRQLDEAILQARFDEKVHVVVIRGSGDKFFCAGADINMLKKADPTFKYYFCLHANETLNRLEQTPKLVIAALNGHTVGGGLEIAMAADIRIARKGAGKVGLPEVNLGVLPGTGGTQRLARLVNKSKAIELMVTAEVFGFEKALELGILNDIWEAASTQEFMDKVQAYAEKFCPPHAASKAVGRIKRSVQSGAELPFESALAVERELQQLLFQGEDAKEGLAAYIEKRKGSFTGR